jgi:hypothetical protein
MRHLLRWMTDLVGDPRPVWRAWRGLPYFVVNACRYARGAPGADFPLRTRELFYASGDRFAPAGSLPTHYFLQDLWVARQLRHLGVVRHVDVGSRVDGFITHVLTFAEVEFVDLRPLPIEVPGLTVRQGSILALPYADGTLATLSCLHVLEHIGLGRYGDAINPAGHRLAASELVRVIAPGGLLLISTPVGRQRLCFDAHRVFDPQTIIDLFRPLELASLALIDDAGRQVIEPASIDQARSCEYGCGIFTFRRRSLAAAS